jgi:pimeloyl-ACP methyl ester carboxylesterase
MSTFVLIPGAGGAAWYWHRVIPLLQQAGHDAIAVDLPGDDEQAGLPEYTDLVVSAIGGRDDVVLVGQSLGGFTATPVAAKVPLRALVLVNAMIPAPGETLGAWWDNTGWAEARIAAAERGGYGTEFDGSSTFCMMSLPRLPPWAPSTSGLKPARCSDQSATSAAGRLFRLGWWPVPATGSSRSSSSRMWRGTGSGSSRTCCPAAT